MNIATLFRIIPALVGTYLHTNTTSNTQFFRNNSNFAVRAHFDAKLAHANNRARLFAFLPASFGFALVGIDDSNTSELVGLLDFASPAGHCPGHVENNMLTFQYNLKRHVFQATALVNGN